MTPGLVSAIVPCRNGAGHLPGSVESLYAAGHPDLEVIVVDDGSTDRTLEVATALAARYASLRVLRHPGGVSLGVSASRNLGIEASSGEYVCFLDADDAVYPGRFSEPVRILAGTPAVDAVYSRTAVVVNHEAGSVWWENEDTFGFREPPPRDELLRVLLKGKSWHTSGILVRREFLDRTGLFDPDLRIAEDCHLWLRMAALGVVVPDSFRQPVSAYVRHAGNTFQPELMREVDFLRAVLRARSWMARMGLAAASTASEECTGYLDGVLVRCYEQRRPDVARALVRMLFAERALAHLLQPRRLRLLLPVLTGVRWQVLSR